MSNYLYNKTNFPTHAFMQESIIPFQVAVGLGITHVLLFVLPFYFTPGHPPSPASFHDPAAVRARVRGILVTSVISTALTVFTCAQLANLSSSRILHLLGIWPCRWFDILQVLGLTAISFAGPLYHAILIDGRWRVWLKGEALIETLKSETGWRTHVSGPFCEELVFRSVILAPHILNSPRSPYMLIWCTPLYFSLAHVHHILALKYTHPDMSLSQRLATVVLQATYTYLFGVFAAFAFLRTGNLPAVIIAHAFCNWRGLPGLRLRVGDEDASIAWTIGYHFVFIGGLVGFAMQLWSWTASSEGLVVFF